MHSAAGRRTPPGLRCPADRSRSHFLPATPDGRRADAARRRDRRRSTRAISGDACCLRRLRHHRCPSAEGWFTGGYVWPPAPRTAADEFAGIVRAARCSTDERPASRGPRRLQLHVAASTRASDLVPNGHSSGTADGSRPTCGAGTARGDRDSSSGRDDPHWGAAAPKPCVVPELKGELRGEAPVRPRAPRGAGGPEVGQAIEAGRDVKPPERRGRAGRLALARPSGRLARGGRAPAYTPLAHAGDGHLRSELRHGRQAADRPAQDP